MNWGVITLKVDTDTEYWYAYVEGLESFGGIAATPEHAVRLCMRNLKQAAAEGREMPEWVVAVLSKRKKD